MRPVRILLGAMPAAVAQQIERIVAHQGDLLLVEGGQRGFDLLAAVESSRAEVVILDLGADVVPGECSHLLGEFPALVLLGVRQEAGEERLYRVTADAVPVRSGGLDRLPEVIRSAVK
jgi:hypothetical protein